MRHRSLYLTLVRRGTAYDCERSAGTRWSVARSRGGRGSTDLGRMAGASADSRAVIGRVALTRGATIVDAKIHDGLARDWV